MRLLGMRWFGMPIVAVMALGSAVSGCGSEESPLPGAGCASTDPIATASTFLTAGQAGDKAIYALCVLPPDAIASIPDAHVDSANVDSYASVVSTEAYAVGRFTERSDDPCCRFAFNAPPSSVVPAPSPYDDPDATVYITVSPGRDGRYYVVDVGYEGHA
jgi:hypothetical protein